jgi:hypothetical protein
MYCAYCNKRFLKTFNLNRHIDRIHAQEKEMDDNDTESSSDVTASSADEEDIQGILDEDEIPTWFRVLRELMTNLGFEKAEDAWKNDENFKKTRKELRAIVIRMMDDGSKLESSQLLNPLFDEERRLMERKGMSEKEARKVAWEHRRFFIKDSLKDIVQNVRSNIKIQPSEEEEVDSMDDFEGKLLAIEDRKA